MIEQTFEEKLESGYYSITALNQMIRQYQEQIKAGNVLSQNRPSINKKIKQMQDYIKMKCVTTPVEKSKDRTSTVSTTGKTITLKTTDKPLTHSNLDVSDEYVARKYLQILNSAKDRGIEFNLSLTSVKNLLKAKKCYYSGYNFDHTDPEKSLTFDRLDYKKGYVKGNVVACYKAVNDLKNVLIEHPVSVFKDNPQLLKKVVDKWIIQVANPNLLTKEQSDIIIQKAKEECNLTGNRLGMTIQRYLTLKQLSNILVDSSREFFYIKDDEEALGMFIKYCVIQENNY